MAKPKAKFVKVAGEVAEILRKAKCDGNKLHLGDQLPPEVYAKVAKVVEIIGGKWNRGMGCHLFNGSAAEAIAEAIGESGQVLDKKKTFQLFETPAEVVEMMLDAINLRPREQVLEPSAGRGAIVRPLTDHGCHVVCVEIDPAHRKDLFDAGAVEVHMMDFLDYAHGGVSWRVDAIAMNPPFTNSQDIEHLRVAHGLLNDGGRMVCLTAKGWQSGRRVPRVVGWCRSPDRGDSGRRLPGQWNDDPNPDSDRIQVKLHPVA